ncbi:hypothetical protein SAMN04244576_00774 [Sinorhizobium meliloti]|nr:hypothetical protein SAMN04244576_00774 [Sinorhizobium meliloti]
MVSRRRTVPGACGRRARNPAADLRRHAVGKVLLALNRMPQVMGNEFRGQRFRRRPGEGAPVASRHQAWIAELRERIFAHALTGEVLEGRQVVVGQQRGELVAPVERQYGVERRAAAGNGCRWHDHRGSPFSS